MPKLNLYSIDANVYATVYVRATSKRSALRAAREQAGACLYFPEDGSQEVPVTDMDFDNNQLPDVSLSTCMTVHGVDRGTVADEIASDVPAYDEDA